MCNSSKRLLHIRKQNCWVDTKMTGSFAICSSLPLMRQKILSLARGGCFLNQKGFIVFIVPFYDICDFRLSFTCYRLSQWLLLNQRSKRTFIGQPSLILLNSSFMGLTIFIYCQSHKICREKRSTKHWTFNCEAAVPFSVS